MRGAPACVEELAPEGACVEERATCGARVEMRSRFAERVEMLAAARVREDGTGEVPIVVDETAAAGIENLIERRLACVAGVPEPLPAPASSSGSGSGSGSGSAGGGSTGFARRGDRRSLQRPNPGSTESSQRLGGRRQGAARTRGARTRGGGNG
jgi:hypothetical protein